MVLSGNRRVLTTVATLASAAALIGGCGSSGSSSEATSTPAGSAAENAAAAKLVPAAVKSKGTLRVAADATYPPNESIAKNGKTVVLVRDLTDTMYNSKMRPQVNHFVGTDLVIEHVEKYWCPTITSKDVVGEGPFKFREDARPKTE